MKILVCSVHFGPGHTAHLNAYCKMLRECGYESALYVDQRYMKLFNDIDGNASSIFRKRWNFIRISYGYGIRVLKI